MDKEAATRVKVGLIKGELQYGLLLLENVAFGNPRAMSQELGNVVGMVAPLLASPLVASPEAFSCLDGLCSCLPGSIQ